MSEVAIGVKRYSSRKEAAMVMKACMRKYPTKAALTIQQVWDKDEQRVKYIVVVK